MAKPHNHVTLGVIYDNLIAGQFPLKVFIYNQANKHHGGQPVYDQGTLDFIINSIAPAMVKEKRELRLVNREDRLVYWVRDGRVVWDGQGPLPPPESATIIENCTCENVPDWLK